MSVAETTSSPFLDHALAYAARGWYVFPLAERSKVTKIPNPHPEGDPLRKKCRGECGQDGHGLYDATTDVGKITTWWARWPNANIGIRTGQPSGIVVVDVDPPDGETTLELLEQVHTPLPETVRAVTGRDGMHYLFAYDDILSGRGAALGVNVDVKAEGGYIVAPPSMGEQGRPYMWLDAPEDIEPAPLPGWVPAVIAERRARPERPARSGAPVVPSAPSAGTTPLAAGALRNLVDEVSHTPEGGGPHGGRDNGLFHAAARMGEFVAGGQITEGEVRDALTTAGITCGLPDRDVARAIASGLTSGAEQPQYPEPGKTHLRVVSEERPTSGASDAHPADRAPSGTNVEILADGFRATESGNANRFVRASDGRARYVHAWGKWIVYDDSGVWRVDYGDALVTELAKSVAQQMFTEALNAGHTTGQRDALLKAARAAEKATSIAAMIKLARAIPGVLVDHQALDNNIWLLNVTNGTIDLRTGVLRAHDPDDLLTLQAPTAYDESAVAPLWSSCLLRWQPDPAMRSYLQRVIGTGATGQPVEHLFINLGPGGNGKGKFYGAVAQVLGDYVVIPHKSLLTVTKHEQHDTIKARLFRARLAIASETDTNDRIDEAKVKDITGGDLLEARRMREDPWKFKPSHTMVMHTNHRPRVRGTDEGVWRRLRLIPWNVSIPKVEQDDQLATKLTEEASGILNWIVRGAREWHEHGLEEPAPVVEATASYRADEDSLAAFVEEYCELHPSYRVAMPDLWKAYEEWCQSSGADPVTKTTFGKMLNERGYDITKDRRYRTGLRLLEDVDARVARVAQMTLTRTPTEEVTGTRAQRAHTESDRTEEESGWNETL